MLSLQKDNLLIVKTILLSLLTVLAAQFSSGQKATFGIKGGMTLSNYTVKETYDNLTFIESSKTKIGPYFGGRVEFKISDKFFLQPELLYNKLGGKSVDGYDVYILDFNYLQVPVYAKFKLQQFSFYGGPQFSLLISSKVKSGSVSVDVSEQIKNVEFSLASGIGYTLTNGFGFDLLFHYGLSKVIKSNEMNVTNNAIGIGVHYVFSK